MSGDRYERLVAALAAVSPGGNHAWLRSEVKRVGEAAYKASLDLMDTDARASVETEAHALAEADVDAAVLGTIAYPTSLATTPSPPLALFVQGNSKLLHHGGIGVCGSRRASAEGLRAARGCGAVAARHDLTLVSGYARGVDIETHTAALRSGGTTVLVLAEGIHHFRIRKGQFADQWDSKRVAVVSQFPPSQTWSSRGAMTRNGVIAGLSRALVVVEAGATGGTLAAGSLALKRGQQVVVLGLHGAPAGNAMLKRDGATEVTSLEELESVLARLDGDSPQLSFM